MRSDNQLKKLREDFFKWLPRYRYIETLGQGGMGVVFRALDQELDDHIALKMLLTSFEDDERELLMRFKQEILLNRRIKHPNVAKVYDFGHAGDYHYITMEYVAGRDLASVRQDEGRFSVERAVPILRQVSLGVGAAHRLGIVHRDLKPQNVMIDADGGVALLDFGLARERFRPGITPAGTVLGTPLFMAPEQLRGEQADTRSDLYSIGVIAFELLTGKRPFDGTSPVGQAISALNTPVPVEELEKASVPDALVAIVLKCLEKERADRFQSTEELERALALSVTGGPERLAAARPEDVKIDQAHRRSSGILTVVLKKNAEGRTVAVPVDVPVSVSTKRPVVLVVDDDPPCRDLVRRTLEKTGCVMLEAENGSEALQLLQTQAVDLVLMDVMMPVMDGFDTTRVLKSVPRFAGLPVVLMSAFPERNRLAFAIQVGATDFIPKPLELGLLRQRIWELLSHLGFDRT